MREVGVSVFREGASPSPLEGGKGIEGMWG